jgi:RecA/RadA recombinase
MPGNHEHSQHTFEKLGVEARDLHAWMDAPWARLGPDHRFLKHDPSDPPIWAVEKYPEGLARRIMEDHIELDDYNFLEELRKLELAELARSERDCVGKSVQVQVRGINRSHLLLDCVQNSFVEGDPIAIIDEGHVRSLGYLLTGEGYLTVVCRGFPEFAVGDHFNVCVDETIAHHLQLALIDRISRGVLTPGEEAVVGKVFGRVLNQRGLKERPRNFVSLDGKYQLDDSQVEVLESILGLREGEVLSVVGPPGSGKTEVIAKAAHELASRGERVLITSHTNRAVDNAVVKLPVDYTLRLGRPERVLRDVLRYTIGEKARSTLGTRLSDLEERVTEIRLSLGTLPRYGESLKETAQFEALRAELIELLKERSLIISEAREEQIGRARIIGSTLLNIASPPYERALFDTVLIDESSQVPLLLALVGMFRAKKWVLIGDHKQLLPIFRTLRNRELMSRLSSFCYFKDRYSDYSRWLSWHYRCNEGIIEFVKRYVYDNRIRIHPSCKDIKLVTNDSTPDYLSPMKPAVFIDVPGNEEAEGGSRLNRLETDLVHMILEGLEEQGIRAQDIGVISPYKAQVRVIRTRPRRRGVEVNTVDSYQGREKDVIIFSATSTMDLSFVEDVNRLNVAFTRARRKLIVIGNERAINSHESLLKRYVGYAAENSAYFRYAEGKIA